MIDLGRPVRRLKTDQDVEMEVILGEAVTFASVGRQSIFIPKNMTTSADAGLYVIEILLTDISTNPALERSYFISLELIADPSEQSIQDVAENEESTTEEALMVQT